ncbi:MAG: cell wall hydrolase [Pseudomonadota bacterium]
MAYAGYSLSLACLGWALALEAGWTSSNPFALDKSKLARLADGSPLPNPPVFHLETAERTDARLPAFRADPQPLGHSRYGTRVRTHHTPKHFGHLRFASLGQGAAYQPAPEKAAYNVPSLDSLHPVRANLGIDENTAKYVWDGIPSHAPLTKEVKLTRQAHCLALAIYFEARGESEDGQVAVSQVILNRVESKRYPNTICGVVYQNAHMRNRCQFSFTCDGKPEHPKEAKMWRQAKRLATQMLCGSECALDPLAPKGGVREATHYHATYVRPGWSYRLRPVGRIGLHKFYTYKTPRS